MKWGRAPERPLLLFVCISVVLGYSWVFRELLALLLGEVQLGPAN